MLIGFDGSRAFIGERTGTENYSYQLLVHLSKIDVENQYLIYLRGGCQVDIKEWPKNFKFKILNFKYLWTQVRLAFQTFQDPLDILFVPAHTLPLIKKPGLKTVMTVHDLGAEYLPAMHQLKQRLYLNLMTHYQLKTASKLVAVSKSTKEDLIRKVGIKEDKIAVVYEGIDENPFQNLKSDRVVDVLRDFDIEFRRYFFFVGTIQPRKNLERLIEAYSMAFSQLEDPPKLVLAGKKGWLSEPIYQAVDKYHLQSKVKFIGRVEDDQLAALLKGAIALTFPSLFEGFGLPILEAYACECPVITSNTSSLPEVAGEGAVLVDPEDTDQIAEAMRGFLILEKDSDKFKVDEEKRKKLLEKGRKQLEKFSWEKCALETLRVFESLK